MLLPATSWNNEISCARGSNWTLWSRILRWNFAPFASNLISSFCCWRQHFQQHGVFAAFESKQNFAERVAKHQVVFRPNFVPQYNTVLTKQFHSKLCRKELRKGWVLLNNFLPKLLIFCCFWFELLAERVWGTWGKSNCITFLFFGKIGESIRNVIKGLRDRIGPCVVPWAKMATVMSRNVHVTWYFLMICFSPERDVCCCWWHISIVCCGIRHAKLLTSKGSCFTNAVGVSTKWIPCTSTAGFADCHSSVGQFFEKQPRSKTGLLFISSMAMFSAQNFFNRHNFHHLLLKFGFFSSFLLQRNSFATLLLRFFTTLSPKFWFDVKLGVEEVVDEERKKGARSFWEM